MTKVKQGEMQSSKIRCKCFELFQFKCKYIHTRLHLKAFQNVYIDVNAFGSARARETYFQNERIDRLVLLQFASHLKII